MIRVISELGTSHGGCFETAIRMQEAAAEANCWGCKLQVRTNFMECTPRHLWDTTREWKGEQVSYLEYRRRCEFSDEQLNALYDHASELGLEWFASVWDVASVNRLAAIQRYYVKVPSAMNTNERLLQAVSQIGFGTAFLSTGMASFPEIEKAKNRLFHLYQHIVLMHCVSVYPCPVELCSLKRITSMGDEFGNEIGYSGHETDILPSLIAVGLGATYIERHLTLDKTQPGSDQACSLEPQEMAQLVRQCQEVEAMLGSGTTFPLPEELPAMRRLRPEKLLTEATLIP